MDLNWEHLAVFLAAAGGVSHGAVGLNFNLNFGDLVNDGQVIPGTGDEARGDYADGYLAASAISVAFNGAVLLLILYALFKGKHKSPHMTKLEHSFWWIVFISVLVAITSAGLDMELLVNYSGQYRDGGVDTSLVTTDTDANVGGTFGHVTTYMNGATVGFSGLALIIGLAGALMDKEAQARQEKEPYPTLDVSHNITDPEVEMLKYNWE